MVNYCGDDHVEYYCPSYGDDPEQTECCWDMKGCCFPWDNYHSSAMFDDEGAWFDHFANMLVIAFGIVFLVAMTCFCLQSCKDTDEYDHDYASDYIIRQEDAEMTTVPIATEENNRTSLGVIRAYDSQEQQTLTGSATSPPNYCDVGMPPPKYEQITSPLGIQNYISVAQTSHPRTPLLSAEQGNWYSGAPVPSAPPLSGNTIDNHNPPPYSGQSS